MCTALNGAISPEKGKNGHTVCRNRDQLSSLSFRSSLKLRRKQAPHNWRHTNCLFFPRITNIPYTYRTLPALLLQILYNTRPQSFSFLVVPWGKRTYAAANPFASLRTNAYVRPACTLASEIRSKTWAGCAAAFTASLTAAAASTDALSATAAALEHAPRTPRSERGPAQ